MRIDVWKSFVDGKRYEKKKTFWILYTFCDTCKHNFDKQDQKLRYNIFFLFKKP